MDVDYLGSSDMRAGWYYLCKLPQDTGTRVLSRQVVLRKGFPSGRAITGFGTIQQRLHHVLSYMGTSNLYLHVFSYYH